MNVKVKTSIVIIGTLLIGILLGMFIDRTIMRNQIDRRIASMRGADGFVRMLDRIIEPSESQRKAIRKILDKRSKQIEKIGDRTQKEMTAIMDSLKSDIEPLLTEDQKQRLERRIEHMRRFPRRRPPFEKHGEPPFMHPDEPPPPPPHQPDEL